MMKTKRLQRMAGLQLPIKTAIVFQILINNIFNSEIRHVVIEILRYALDDKQAGNNLS